MLVFLGAVAVVAIVGIVVGMLIAPRLGRLSERVAESKHEDAGDGTD